MKTKTKRIIIAKTAGFCFGVKRAIELAEKTAREKGEALTFGPLIHNPQEVRRLEQCGIKSVDSVEGIKNTTLVIRTHGIPEQLKEKLSRADLDIVDATCPFVKRAQDMVRDLSNKGFQVIIVGDRTHPEVIGLVSYARKDCHVVESLSDITKVKISDKIGIVSQTTQTPEVFDGIIKYVKEKNPKAKIFNTICRATIDRQSEAKSLSKRVDLIIVVGGKNSGNTRRLFEISKLHAKTHAIETASELRRRWFAGVRTIGITAGASTPGWVISDVRRKIMDFVESE